MQKNIGAPVTIDNKELGGFLGLSILMLFVLSLLACQGSLDDKSSVDPDLEVEAFEIAVELIPAGTFHMGCTEGDAECLESEYPLHTVEITRVFNFMRTEVTQELYEFVMGENPSEFKLAGDYPVEEVNWYDAVAFANELNLLEGRELCYTITEDGEGGKSVDFSGLDCSGWRLPTEAEWEYAARGGEDFIYAGSETLDDIAWFENNSSEQSHPVAQKQPNGFGLYDMSGNVEEWCWDGFQEDSYLLYAEQGTVQDPTGSNSPVRVLRGGGWGHTSRSIRVSNRIFVSAESVRRIFGIRLVRGS